MTFINVLRRRSLSLLLVTGVLAGACTAGSTSTSPSPAGAPLQKVKIALNVALDQLDPKVGVNTGQLIVLTAGMLYRLDRNAVPQPDLVQSSSVSSDFKTVTMTLKSGLLYSDGLPIQAADVVAAVTRQKDKGAGAALLVPVVSLEATDERTVVWHLDGPFPDLAISLANALSAIHPRDKVKTDPAYFGHPVSGGPFEIVEWTPGAPQMVLRENPKYNGGPMMIKNLTIASVPDLSSRVLQLATGALDLAYDIPATSVSSLPKEVKTINQPITGLYHVAFNLAKAGPLQDPVVRKAITLAIDRDAVNTRAFAGTTFPAKGYMYQGVPEFEITLPNEGKRDLEGAKRLLATTPYATGFAFTLQTWGARPGWKDAAIVIAENLKDLGLTVTVEPVEDAVALANLAAGNFVAQFSGLQAAPLSYLGLAYGKTGIWSVWTNYAGKHPEIDRLLSQATQTTDPGQRRSLVSQIAKVVSDDPNLVPIVERTVVVGTRLSTDILYFATPGSTIRVSTVSEYGHK
jgi:peptide/nickel transport system substrate-binding protein